MSDKVDRVRELLVKERVKTATLLTERYKARRDVAMTNNKEASNFAAKKLSMKALGTDIVHIKVGAELQDYGIHKSLICDASKYFRAAFTSGYEESKSGIMTLDTVEPRTFGLFYGWLYSHTIWDKNSEDSKPDHIALAKLYVFADMTEQTPLKNAAIRLLYEVIMDGKDSNGFVNIIPDMMAYIWGNALASSPLRRFVLDICIFKVRWNGASLSTATAGLDTAIFLDILQAMSDRSLFKSSTGGSVFKLASYEEAEMEGPATMNVKPRKNAKPKKVKAKVETTGLAGKEDGS